MTTLGHALIQDLATRAGVPSGVHLQVADRCNHACRHCYQVQGLKGEMSTDEIFSIIDDLAAAGIMLLNISGGEATLRPDLLDILRYARKRGFALRLFTNAFTMTPELAADIAAIGVLGVDVSVYSDDPAHHDSITRVPGSHEKTVEGVRALVRAGIRVHLKAPATSLVPDAGERVRRLGASLGDSVSVITSNDITPMENGDMSSRDLAPDPDDLVRRGALRAWQPPEDLPGALQQSLAHPTCGACKDGVTVLANGDLRPCTDIVAPMGNLRDRRFLELYRSEEAAFVSSFTWADVHGCRDCDLRLACGRCHAHASQESGDSLGPYQSACDSALARYRGSVGKVTVLAAGSSCHPDRASTSGPFRIVSPGVLQPIADVLTDTDRERRERFPWVRPSTEFLTDMSRGEPGPRRLPIVKSAR